MALAERLEVVPVVGVGALGRRRMVRSGEVLVDGPCEPFEERSVVLNDGSPEDALDGGVARGHSACEGIPRLFHEGFFSQNRSKHACLRRASSQARSPIYP